MRLKQQPEVKLAPSSCSDYYSWYRPKQIVELAAKNGVPTMFATSQYVDAGGLTSYGRDYADLWRRAATYVDKILKGDKARRSPCGATDEV